VKILSCKNKIVFSAINFYQITYTKLRLYEYFSTILLVLEIAAYPYYKNGKAHLKKCKRLFEYQHLHLLRKSGGLSSNLVF